jgi:mRNA interferase MazF
MYVKEFDRWNTVKQNLQKQKSEVFIRSGEIRWCTVGVNVGSEIDGKGESFTRPVLVLHVIGNKLALIVPLSTQKKSVPGYYSFFFKGLEQALCIHQIKIISSKRLLRRKGKLTKNRLYEIKKQISEFYNFPSLE